MTRRGQSISIAPNTCDISDPSTGCVHTKGKAVVSRGEAYARIQAACDARDEGLDIFVLARTDSLISGWDEAMTRAKEFARIAVDGIFVEALPDAASMRRAVKEIGVPTFANIIEGGLTQNLSAKDLAELGVLRGCLSLAIGCGQVEGHKRSIREPEGEHDAGTTTRNPQL